MKHSRNFILFLLAALIFSSCKDTITTTTGGAPGNIVGFVQVYDSLRYSLSDASGVTVSLAGTSISAISDATGRWQLSNVPPGTYKLFFSKPGFSSMEDFNIVFQGNGTYYYDYSSGKQTTVSLYQLYNLYPDIVIRPFEDYISVLDTSYYDTSGYYHYVYDTVVSKYYSAVFSSRSITPPGYDYYHSTAIYFGKTRNINPIDSKSFLFMSSIMQNVLGNDSTGTIADITILKSDLLKAGFSSGDSIYCSAFSGMINILNTTTWVDPETNKTVYSGFSPHHSDVVSFILP